MIVGYIRGVHVRDRKTVYLDISRFSEAVNDFAAFERSAAFLFDPGKHIVKIGVGKRTAGTFAYLHDQYGIDICIVLLVGILIPPCAFLLPFFNGCFQQDGVIAFCLVIRISNNDAILEKPRTAHVIRRYHTCLQADVGDIADECIESLRRGADAEHNRHRAHTALYAVFHILIALDKALHDSGIRSGGGFCFCAAVRLVNDEVKMIRLVCDRIVKSLPYRILTEITVLCQITAFADLLRVEKIDLPVLQHFAVK